MMDIVIRSSSGQSIYEQIYTQIKNSILSEEIKAGQPLPSIRGLAKDLRISVITTKRAYDELEKDGFIYSVAGKGSYVSNTDSDVLKEQNLLKIEKLMERIVELSYECKLSEDEIFDMLRLQFTERY